MKLGLYSKATFVFIQRVGHADKLTAEAQEGASTKLARSKYFPLELKGTQLC